MFDSLLTVQYWRHNGTYSPKGISIIQARHINTYNNVKIGAKM